MASTPRDPSEGFFAGVNKMLQQSGAAAQARDDVLDGFVSAQSALEDYGVVLKPQTLDVDEAATQQQRRRMRRQTTMFHRGKYLTAID